MDYDEFIETQELMIQYAQKAINIYDEIYTKVDNKFKQGMNSIQDVKGLTWTRKDKHLVNRYIVDEDEATFEDFGIEFYQESEWYGNREEKTIYIPKQWLIPDPKEQRNLIEENIKQQCEAVREQVEERERKDEEARMLRQKKKEEKDREEYLRLKQKFGV